MAVGREKEKERGARLFFEKKHGTTVVEMVKRSTIGGCGTIVVAHLSFHAVFCSCFDVLLFCSFISYADRLRLPSHRGDARMSKSKMPARARARGCV